MRVENRYETNNDEPTEHRIRLIMLIRCGGMYNEEY